MAPCLFNVGGLAENFFSTDKGDGWKTITVGSYEADS